jgi:hypothetical protein
VVEVRNSRFADGDAGQKGEDDGFELHGGGGYQVGWTAGRIVGKVILSSLGMEDEA